MKNIKNNRATKTRGSQLRRFALAASNMKFACEFALECMELLKKAKDPELVKDLNKSINEVTSILGQRSMGKNSNRQRMNNLNTLGAIFLDQLNPSYTLLARGPSFKILDLLR